MKHRGLRRNFWEKCSFSLLLITAINDICSNRHQRGWDFVSPLLGKSRHSSRNFFTLSVLNEARLRITSTSPTQQKVDALSLAVNLAFINMMRMALAFAGLPLLWKGTYYWMKFHCFTFDMGFFFLFQCYWPEVHNSLAQLLACYCS